MEQKILVDKAFGRNLWRLRRACGLTQEEMTARLQVLEVDISRGTYAKIEAGIHHISIRQLKAIRKILKVDWSELFGD